MKKGLFSKIAQAEPQPRKYRLHKVPYPFSMRGFIDFSLHVKELVQNPESDQIENAILFQDEQGNQRLLLRTKRDATGHNEYISAFKAISDSDFRVSTYIPDFTDRNFAKSIRLMGDSTEQSKYYNRMTGEIKQHVIK